MIRHVFKLIWNRKRTNFLMMTRDLRLVPRAVRRRRARRLHRWTTGAGRSGFSIDRVWDVSIDMKQMSDDDFTQQQQETVRQVMLAFREFPEIERSAGTDACAVPVRLVQQQLPVARPHDRVRRHRGHRRVQGPAGPADRRGPLVRSARTTASSIRRSSSTGRCARTSSAPARRSARPSIRTKSRPGTAEVGIRRRCARPGRAGSG